MCLQSCDIDAIACSTSLTEDSSGMEMDFMLTMTRVPDALVLKKGIGWVWLRTIIAPLGWDQLNCTVCSLFVVCYAALFVYCLFVCQCICLQAIPISSLFLAVSFFVSHFACFGHGTCIAFNVLTFFCNVIAELKLELQRLVAVSSCTFLFYYSKFWDLKESVACDILRFARKVTVSVAVFS